jgi:hypothetical protein
MIEKVKEKVYNHHSYGVSGMITFKRACLLLLLVPLLGLSGCAADRVKPSEDSIIARKALNSASIIRDAYIQKEEGIIRENVEVPLSGDIVRMMKFDRAELSFKARFITITASQVLVKLNWHGTWTTGGNDLQDRGSGTLVFHRDTMKLGQVDGDNPFQIPLVR